MNSKLVVAPEYGRNIKNILTIARDGLDLAAPRVRGAPDPDASRRPPIEYDLCLFFLRSKRRTHGPVSIRPAAATSRSSSPAQSFANERGVASRRRRSLCAFEQIGGRRVRQQARLGHTRLRAGASARPRRRTGPAAAARASRARFECAPADGAHLRAHRRTRHAPSGRRGATHQHATRASPAATGAISRRRGRGSRRDRRRGRRPRRRPACRRLMRGPSAVCAAATATAIATRT